MLLTELRRLARAADSGFAAVESEAADAVFGANDGAFESAEAKIIEADDGRLRALAVGPPAATGFTSFLDGIQRSRIALYYGPVPVVYAYAAAVIRTRAGRRLRTQSQRAAEAAFFPFRHLAPERVAAAARAPEQLVDTSPPNGEPLPLFPPLLYARAAEQVNRFREGLERALAEAWCRETQVAGDWLLVDGSLTISAELAACPRAVGLIKSHRTRFFDGDDARVLIGLTVGERTSVFQPQTRRYMPVYSWYLRLRSPAGRDALWGLVRVEAAAQEATPERADEISRWLLAETAPLSLPDARWDRLLYPIHDCEEYLRARAPAV